VLTVAGWSHAGQTAHGRADRQDDGAVIDQEAASPIVGAARVVKRAVDATADEIASELQDALKEAGHELHRSTQ
jgi:hypothetical protein